MVSGGGGVATRPYVSLSVLDVRSADRHVFPYDNVRRGQAMDKQLTFRTMPKVGKKERGRNVIIRRNANRFCIEMYAHFDVAVRCRKRE